MLPQCEEGRQGGGRGRLSASQAGGEDGRTLGVLVEARLAVDAAPRVRLVGWEPTWRGEQGRHGQTDRQNQATPPLLSSPATSPTGSHSNYGCK